MSVHNHSLGAKKSGLTHSHAAKFKSRQIFVLRFSFVAKFLPREDPNRMYVFETDVFRKESEIYFDVLPAIKSCLRFVTRKKNGS